MSITKKRIIQDLTRVKIALITDKMANISVVKTNAHVKEATTCKRKGRNDVESSWRERKGRRKLCREKTIEERVEEGVGRLGRGRGFPHTSTPPGKENKKLQNKRKQYPSYLTNPSIRYFLTSLIL